MLEREHHLALLEELSCSRALLPFRGLISPLVSYDRKHNSDLVRTLRVFFEANANASEAAERLFLHRNSMTYRLARISELTGLDLKDPSARLALQLGLLAEKRQGKEISDES
ncbi:helix-turn-helix domain-containing protein [Rubrobacter calidifluminis]|uniref:helix-turn-helix domain-containing protein n=1 Tax=Rubrobacter calidifluminis TaxID=1392640 RepID=UPI0023619B7B|nr:helix-turn-helix domain-containing protein [Rubrobacter calidifluminis]